ncbi:hypothetical protein CRUP_015215 [Coryphaenoides rupestris]|nr:hypothetical protein CRUP_015215 [Coryphaenoides rupestris]
MELPLSAAVFLCFVSSASAFLFTPRGPQMYPCITTWRRTCAWTGVPADRPAAGALLSNVSLVNPTLCRLTWAPLDNDKPYTFTCRVYQGLDWKENSLAIHQRLLPICSALSVTCGPWLLMLVLSLHMVLGPLGP